jgi:hypothetical protein
LPSWDYRAAPAPPQLGCYADLMGHQLRFSRFFAKEASVFQRRCGLPQQRVVAANELFKLIPHNRNIVTRMPLR